MFKEAISDASAGQETVEVTTLLDAITKQLYRINDLIILFYFS